MSDQPENPSKWTPHCGDDVLLPWERRHLQGTYRDFVNDKRGCRFNTMRAFPEIWRTFELLDETWSRELNDFRSPGHANRILPLLLLYNAHVKFRIGFELGFSRCLGEAGALLRAAVEYVACACKILENPSLAIVWTSRSFGAEHERAFRKAFEGRRNLFDPASEWGRLAPFWLEFSGFGSHARLRDLGVRLNRDTSGSHIEFRYLEVEAQTAEVLLIRMLACFIESERLFFENFRSRLQLDSELAALRAKCHDSFRAVVERAKRLAAPSLRQPDARGR